MSRRLTIPLLIITTLVLPRLTAQPAAQATSADRPEHPFLTPLTSNPLNTVLWTAVGALASAVLLKRDGDLISASLAQLVSTFLLVIPFTCLGAPLKLSTLALATQISALTVFPAVYTLGLPSLNEKGLAARYRMTRLFSEFSPESRAEMQLVLPALGAVAGAYLGAFSLALDWDRPWQIYPLPPSIGATIGYIAASLYA